MVFSTKFAHIFFSLFWVTKPDGFEKMRKNNGMKNEKKMNGKKRLKKTTEKKRMENIGMKKTELNDCRRRRCTNDIGWNQM